MKWFSNLPFFVLCLWAACRPATIAAQERRPPPPSNTGIDGTVIDSITRKPLDGVHIVLVEYGSNNMPSALYGAMSNAAGHFSIAGIPFGQYPILWELTGFVMVPKTNRDSTTFEVLELKPGEQVHNVVLEMTPRAIISGRVLDEYGDPMMSIPVAAVKIAPQALYERGRREVATNDRGEFRFSLPPGRYYIQARILGAIGPGSGPPEIRTDGTAESTYLETYYPSAIDTEAATPVEARPGQESSGIEIRMARSPALSISGTVSGIPDDDQATVTISFETAPDNDHIPGYGGPGAFTGRKREGKFQLGHLKEGLYRIYAQCRTGAQELQSQIVELTLTDAKVEDLNLSLAPGAEVAGTIDWSGSPATTKAQPTVKLRPAGVLDEPRARSSSVAPDGTFKIKDVFSEKYRVIVEPLPGNAFVKTVRLNGTAMDGGGIDLSGGAEGAKLKITLDANGGQVAGQVHEATGAVSPFGAVVLMPDQRDASRFDEWRVSNVGADGAYSFNGLPPGRYRVLAVPRFGGIPRDIEDAVKRFATAADAIEIKGGDKISKDLTMGGPEDRNGSQK
jgi:hypothetical protein